MTSTDLTQVRAAAPSESDSFASGYTKISVGYRHSCGVRSDGTVRCWGYNEGGELGIGTQTYVYHAIPIQGISNAVDVSSGQRHSCALLETGQVRCWGSNGNGQLGDDTFEPSTTPVTVVGVDGLPLVNVVQVVASVGFTCARLATGQINCWGSSWGLGDNSDEDRGHAAPTAEFGSAIDISAPTTGWDKWVCAIGVGGDVYCWGKDVPSGQKIGVPTKKEGISGATSVMVGSYHACVTLADTSLRCWGSDYYGQTGSKSVGGGFSTVDGLAVSELADGGLDSTCVVSTDGKARCWGSGWNARLGNGTTTDRTNPVTVKTDRLTDLTNVDQISMGEGNTCALTTAGFVYCWGYMGYTARPWATWGTDETAYAGRIAENPNLEIVDTAVNLSPSLSAPLAVAFGTNLNYCDYVSGSYEVRISRYESMSDAILLTGSICKSESVVVANALSPGQTYYYRVDVRSSFGHASSPVKTFTTKGKKPVLSLVPYSPFDPISRTDSKARVPFAYDGDGLAGSFGLEKDCELSKSPTMATNDAREVERTVIQSDGVERNKDFLSLSATGMTFVCTYLQLEPLTTYFYRVTLMNSLGLTSSDIGSFTTRKRSGISINNGALYTTTTKVNLVLALPQIKAGGVLVANDGGFAKAESFSPQTTESPEFTMPWTLDSAGDERLPKTVYIRFTSASGNQTTLTDDIILDTRSPEVSSVTSDENASAVGLKIKASDDNSGLDDVQVKTDKGTVTVDYSSSLSVSKKVLGLSVGRESVSAFASSSIRVRVSDKAGNWSDWEVVGSGIGVGSSGSKLVIGGSSTASKLASLAKMKVAAGSKLSVKTTGTPSKICRVSRGAILAVSGGVCRVVVTATPKKGKPVSKTVSLTIVRK